MQDALYPFDRLCDTAINGRIKQIEPQFGADIVEPECIPVGYTIDLFGLRKRVVLHIANIPVTPRYGFGYAPAGRAAPVIFVVAVAAFYAQQNLKGFIERHQ